jgi:ribosome-binding ATPase YchF (GTP1/OBG family)
LVRLKERISELHVEIDAAKEDFRHLHRERGLLTKERDIQKVDIESWSARCKELQMLKFGREIDLDELEANSDQTKEKEAEEVLQHDAEKFKAKSAQLFRTSARLEEELAAVSSVCVCMCVYVLLSVECIKIYIFDNIKINIRSRGAIRSC